MDESTIESLLLYGFIFLLFLVFTVLLVLLVHSGFFTHIEVSTCKPSFDGFRIAYKYAKGPYKESGALFSEVHSLLPQYKTLGVYYDDPKLKESYRLRYVVGIILEENDKGGSCENDEKVLAENGYKFFTFPPINHAVQATFPFKSTISIIVGIFRVYPIIDEFIQTRGLCAHPFFEIYDSEKETIFFIGPLERQSDFYVPEVLEDEDKMDTIDGTLESSISQTGEMDFENEGDESTTKELK